tara:strand:+ start:51696 stop:51905 length:210 start_codon:yes stop_codon:yes gene_type:complete
MPQNAGRNDAETEAMHQWMHQIAITHEQSQCAVLLCLVIETLGDDALDQVADAIRQRAALATADGQQRQ